VTGRDLPDKRITRASAASFVFPENVFRNQIFDIVQGCVGGTFGNLGPLFLLAC